MAKDKPDQTEQIEILRIRETEKTKRYVILTLGVVSSLGIIAWAAVRLMDKPPWLAFALAVLAALSGPSTLLAITVRFVWSWTSRHMGRTARLEMTVDPNRSTSSLNPDGTDPPEALP